MPVLMCSAVYGFGAEGEGSVCRGYVVEACEFIPRKTVLLSNENFLKINK